MKPTIFAALAALALAACTPTVPISIPPAPVTVADRTVADERLAASVELAYQAWVYAIELGIDTGIFKGPRAAAIAKLDMEVYAAVVAVRYAYKTANAADYLTAYSNARATLTRAIAAAKGLKNV